MKFNFVVDKVHSCRYGLSRGCVTLPQTCLRALLYLFTKTKLSIRGSTRNSKSGCARPSSADPGKKQVSVDMDPSARLRMETTISAQFLAILNIIRDESNVDPWFWGEGCSLTVDYAPSSMEYVGKG